MFNKVKYPGFWVIYHLQEISQGVKNIGEMFEKCQEVPRSAKRCQEGPIGAKRFAGEQRPKKSKLSSWQTLTHKNFPDGARKSFLPQMRQKSA